MTVEAYATNAVEAKPLAGRLAGERLCLTLQRQGEFQTN